MPEEKRTMAKLYDKKSTAISTGGVFVLVWLPESTGKKTPSVPLSPLEIYLFQTYSYTPWNFHDPPWGWVWIFSGTTH